MHNLGTLQIIDYENIELLAKLLDYFLRSNKSNINQLVYPLLITALVVTCTLLRHPTSHALPTSPIPRQRELVCGACIGTTQVAASLAAPLNSLFKRSTLRSPRDIILVFVTWRNIMPVSAWKVYIVQERLHIRRVHTRAVSVLFKMCTEILLCVYPVSVLLKIWWQYIQNFPTQVCTSIRYAFITVVNKTVLYLFP